MEFSRRQSLLFLLQNLPLTLVALVVKWFGRRPCKQNCWVALSGLLNFQDGGEGSRK